MQKRIFIENIDMITLVLVRLLETIITNNWIAVSVQQMSQLQNNEDASIIIFGLQIMWSYFIMAVIG